MGCYRRPLFSAPADILVGMRRYRYLHLLTIGFVVILLISNLIGPKICQLGPLRPSAAEFLFPLTYICGDVFTEVYGYGSSRRAIWLGFFAMALLAAMGQIAVVLPPAPEWKGQEAFATVFGLVPRFAFASLVAYWAGEFTNSYTLAKLKLLTGGRWLWTRTVGSTVTGQAVDTAVIVVIAFAGSQPPLMLMRMVLSSYLIKVAVEVIATPVTYLVVARLKRVENVDAYDRRTNFNPFAFQGEKA
jgi:queuosine precursor transporter